MTTELLAGRPVDHLIRRARASPIRWTHLRRMLESPLHYLASFEDEQKDNAEMRIGRVVDAYVLHGEYPLVFGGKSRSGEKWERFELANKGREILTVSENDRARFAADSIDGCSAARAALSGGVAHPEYEWFRGGRLHQAHPDYVAANFTTEIKVTFTAKPERFVPIAKRLGYPSQLAMYFDAIKATRGIAGYLDRFIVAAEYDSPYITSVFRLRERAMEEARERLEMLYAMLDRCERTNEWPGYGSGVVNFDDFDGGTVAEDFERVG